jgi:S-formylglutathione hydrolase FrmB
MSRQISPWRATVVAVALAACAAASPSLAAAQSVNIASPKALKLTSTVRIDSRITQLTFTTPALVGPEQVRVMLPTGYAHSRRRYAVLYLLHGSTGDAAQWTTQGYSAEPLTAHLPLIVVMPDDGSGGEYANWWNNGKLGPPEWQTFDLNELLPWIDQHYRTIAKRADRAISGNSMGGLGTMEYASRQPDLFSVAESLSGAVSLASADGELGVVFNEALEGTTIGSIYANPLTGLVQLKGQSPTDLSMNLSGTKLGLYWHNGLPGKQGGTDIPVELVVKEDSEEMNAELNLLHIPHLGDDLGNGTHDVVYFNQELSLALTQIMSAFKHPAAAPRKINYASTAPSYSQWGWAVAVTRPATEFSGLENAQKSGFALFGSGAAAVTTPADYKPGARYRVTITPAKAGEPGAAEPEGVCVSDKNCLPYGTPPPYATKDPIVPGTAITLTLAANRYGRLLIEVPLGTGNTAPEYTFPGYNSATLIYRTSVAITRA